ncbi:MAG TPA: maleylpyruvate isomerase family mycothiol-dependent enzyme [Acidimicrobiales bacterium]|nr:maleylpyruvate isomerase family mycothiol-dependent enzyme [Acidimicrobiales bacterium]
MQLTPRYDDDSFLTVGFPVGDPAVPMLRQRRRLAATLAGFDEAQWAAPSRCEGWSVKDVVAHLVSTNQFWSLSFTTGRRREPTRFLATFDPVSSPAALVDASREQLPAEVLAAFEETNEALAGAVEGLVEADWDGLVAEAPPGHVPLRAVALHALWDGWIHERDVLLPLGRPAVQESDEVAGALAYVAALSPLFAAAGGAGGDRAGAVVVDATDPDVRVVVDVAGGTVRVHDGEARDDAVRLAGPAVDLLEGLSFRAPLPDGVEVDDEHRWLLGGLATVFDRSA